MTLFSRRDSTRGGVDGRDSLDQVFHPASDEPSCPLLKVRNSPVSPALERDEEKTGLIGVNRRLADELNADQDALPPRLLGEQICGDQTPDAVANDDNFGFHLRDLRYAPGS
jgi:hypothetical protein